MASTTTADWQELWDEIKEWWRSITDAIAIFLVSLLITLTA
jgi:hypothetical protein